MPSRTRRSSGPGLLRPGPASRDRRDVEGKTTLIEDMLEVEKEMLPGEGGNATETREIENKREKGVINRDEGERREGRSEEEKEDLAIKPGARLKRGLGRTWRRTLGKEELDALLRRLLLGGFDSIHSFIVTGESDSNITFEASRVRLRRNGKNAFSPFYANTFLDVSSAIPVVKRPGCLKHCLINC